ncbi:MAG: hypothetical protein LLF96_13390 [Eubacteriales bacterium]|nr:hypothetical protein [Eubacteriales bacterium]
MAEPVLEALRAMRPPFAPYEADLHQLIARRLSECGYAYQHEASLAAGCRIDYLVGDVGIEIKKGKPRPAELLRQLTRYAQCDGIQSLIVLTWRSVKLPEKLLGKPVRTLTLSQLWGVSLP